MAGISSLVCGMEFVSTERLITAVLSFNTPVSSVKKKFFLFLNYFFFIRIFFYLFKRVINFYEIIAKSIELNSFALVRIL